MYYLGYTSLQSGDIFSGYTFSWAWENYSDAFTLYREHFIRSLEYAALATLIAFLISYPLAYWIAFRGGRWKNLLLLLIIAGICGAIGRAIAGGPRGGFIVSIAVGFIGALLGTIVAQKFRLPELLVVAVDHHAFPILWSIIGAALFVAVVHLIGGGGLRRQSLY